jgi:hypothetical protein
MRPHRFSQTREVFFFALAAVSGDGAARTIVLWLPSRVYGMLC